MGDPDGNITMFGLTADLGAEFGGRHGFDEIQGRLKEGELSTKSMCTEHSSL